MRRHLTILSAATAVLAASLLMSPAQAAPAAAPAIAPAASVELVRDYVDGPGGNRFFGPTYEQQRNWRHRDRDRYDRRHRVRQGYYIPFPFFYQQPRRDCYQGRDGRLYCAR